MDYEVEEIVFKSSNKINTVHGKILKPTQGEIKGVIQVCHGMCEYFDKYHAFTDYLIENGFIVCGHDHIGHGDSVNSLDERGFFAHRDGYKFLIEDTKRLSDIVKEKYPTDSYYLFGHSMGSLIARCYAAKFGTSLNGLIICGTVGPQPLVGAGIKLAKLIANAKGELFRSKKLYNLALDFANIKFLPVQTRYDWISSDEEEVTRHISDEKSNFIFTVSGFEDLFHLALLANSEKVIKTVPKELPILFISGACDPLGENGTGVKNAIKLYKEAGVISIKCKLYENCRHELMREKNKKDVYKDICEWIKNRVEKC